MAVHVDASIIADINTECVRVGTCDACDIVVGVFVVTYS
jgi:hypothetical protein